MNTAYATQVKSNTKSLYLLKANFELKQCFQNEKCNKMSNIAATLLQSKAAHYETANAIFDSQSHKNGWCHDEYVRMTNAMTDVGVATG